MIRINLIERARRAQKEKSQSWLLLLLLGLAIEVIALFFWYAQLSTELEDLARRNQALEKEIRVKEAAAQDHANVRARLEALKAREDAINRLQTARTGPAAALLELARLLTPGRGPSTEPDVLNRIKRENPLAMYSVTWDPRRIWLTEVDEIGTGEKSGGGLADLGYALKDGERAFRIAGRARDGEDVAELAKRLNLSGYFNDVALLPGKGGTNATGAGAAGAGDHVDFALVAKVRY